MPSVYVVTWRNKEKKIDNVWLKKKQHNTVWLRKAPYSFTCTVFVLLSFFSFFSEEPRPDDPLFPFKQYYDAANQSFDAFLNIRLVLNFS